MDYDFKYIEQTVQMQWEDGNAFVVTEDDAKEKYYCVSMFPYPSGKLHMGHVRNYTIGDVVSRSQRMLGKNVCQPMGWDAFGLPAENAAIQNKTSPASWTYNNIGEMKAQLTSLGFSFDWSRELTTCKAEYYEHEQRFFTRLFEKGLVYRKLSTVNWDPVDKTVLANEQVINGKGWRSDAMIEQKEILQWFIKITEYADQLHDDLDKLSEWPAQVVAMQHNWIGRSEGLDVAFSLTSPINDIAKLDVYTTRPDTLLGVTYLAIAPKHALAKIIAIDNTAVASFIESCQSQKITEAELSKMDKKGIDTGFTAIHPLSGNKVPIYIANFVLLEYGSGAVMAVPAHDQRDWDFATKYNLPIIPVIESENDHDYSKCAMTEKGRLINSNDFEGMSYDDAFNAIATRVEDLGIGSKSVNYRLRDWGISRQRYWGAPIPMINLPNGESIPATDLPVVLPEDKVIDGISSPLKDDPEWRKVMIEGVEAERETDTFDTFMESSWYYAKYASPCNRSMLDPEKTSYWLPVDMYIGGIEHAVLHLLYARFFHKLLRDDGLVDSDEPFKRLLCQGMVCDHAFSHQTDDSIEWIHSSNVDVEYDNGSIVKARHKQDGTELKYEGCIKMSKSKNNGIEPHEILTKYGADTIRLYIMFAAPPENSFSWVDTAVKGTHTYIKKVNTLWHQHLQLRTANKLKQDYTSEINEVELDENAQRLYAQLQNTISVVTHDVYERQHFNTAIARLMELTKAILRFSAKTDLELKLKSRMLVNLIQMLNPFTPHLSQYLWAQFEDGLIDFSAWPEAKEFAFDSLTKEIVVQVNGKIRASLTLTDNATESEILEAALVHPNIRKYVDEGSLVNTIFVPNKLVNLITK